RTARTSRTSYAATSIARCRVGAGSSTSRPTSASALEDPASRERLRAALDAETAGLAVGIRSGWGQCIVHEPEDPGLAHLDGRRVGDIARERGVSDFDAVLDIAVAAKLRVGFVRYAFTDADEWTANARIEVL